MAKECRLDAPAGSVRRFGHSAFAFEAPNISRQDARPMSRARIGEGGCRSISGRQEPLANETQHDTRELDGLLRRRHRVPQVWIATGEARLRDAKMFVQIAPCKQGPGDVPLVVAQRRSDPDKITKPLSLGKPNQAAKRVSRISASSGRRPGSDMRHLPRRMCKQASQRLLARRGDAVPARTRTLFYVYAFAIAGAVRRSSQIAA
jgi:hypothetical protein